jgi:hypothetical protein
LDQAGVSVRWYRDEGSSECLGRAAVVRGTPECYLVSRRSAPARGANGQDEDCHLVRARSDPKAFPRLGKAKLESVATKVMADPRVRERLANLDVTPDFAPVSVLRTKLESDIRN